MKTLKNIQDDLNYLASVVVNQKDSEPAIQVITELIDWTLDLEEALARIWADTFCYGTRQEFEFTVHNRLSQIGLDWEPKPVGRRNTE